MKTNEDLLSVLLAAGIGSRRKVAAAVMQGRVTVNGIESTGLRQPVNSQKDIILVDGKGIRQQRKEEYVYLALNKPAGVLSTVSDERGRRTVLEFIPGQYRKYRLYPAGRLDKDTTGLLLLTNDGDFTNRITHPRYEHEKEYNVTVNRELTEEEIGRLEQGIDLEDGLTSPAKVTAVENAENTYSITIHEGKKRQVRRMFVMLGCRVLALKRVRMGKLLLGSLKEGEVREVSQRDIKRWFDIK